MPHELLMVTSSFPYGNGEAFIAAELEGLAAAGVGVLVYPLWPRGPRAAWTPPPGVRVWSLGRRDLRIHRNVLRGVKWGVEARAVGTGRAPLCGAATSIRRETVAVALGSSLASVAARAGTTHIHAYWATGPATAAFHAAALLKVPWSMTAHSGDIYDNHPLRYKAESSAFIRVISESGRRAAMDLGIPENCTRLVRLGVVLPPSPRKSGVDRGRSPRVVCVASLIPHKGHVYLIKALASLRKNGLSFPLDIAGAGPEKSSIRALAQAEGVSSQIRFLGHLDHRALMECYARGVYDLMVLPSSGTGSKAEGIPVSLMEAMAHGIPSIGTDAGGVPELIPKGSPMLVPPGDSEALAGAIRLVLTSDAVWKRASTHGRRIVESEFNNRVNGARLAALMMADHD